MGRQMRWWINGVLAVLVVGLGLWMYLSGPPRHRSREQQRKPVSTSGGATRGNLKQGEEWVGGIKRPKSDLVPVVNVVEPAKSHKKPDDSGYDYGTTPPVKPDANPQVASVYRRIVNRKADPQAYGRAVSVAARPEPFDAHRYQEDENYRSAYLNNPEPGRVFAPAAPGPGVPVIMRASPHFQEARQDEVVSLRVRSGPGRPVTFTSFDLGRFQNDSTSVTVQADGRGVAEARFVASSGTAGEVNIMAAGPMSSGQVRFVVHVPLPSGAPGVGVN